MTRPAAHLAISGAGTGIGKAIALRLAKTGARLSLFARDEKRLAETARACSDMGAASVSIRGCDITKKDQVERSFAEFAREHGPLHALVANSGIAGVNIPGEKDRFEEIVATNLIGNYNCLRAAQTHLAPGPEARHLIVIGSVLARIGIAYYSGYCASKAGLLGLVRSMAVELAPENVLVNAVCPGWVDTDMAREGLDGMAAGLRMTREAAKDLAMQQVPLRRMAEPEEVAGMVAWLLSPDARNITGQALDMNGGAYMH
ncbi:MAG TPA: SDR family NAD(P)-dependent oxidoreductase [Planctomycetota bacterium]|nr:SDR family NAD(P)-dependent oxidoreductase [Planctomycetota bacterium]